MAKPTFIFVPGAWHTPAVFSRVIKLLSTHGYDSHGLTLPSVGANPGLPSFDADVTSLQTLINKLLSADKDIVIVLWSYGGAVGTEAVLPSMLKSSRQNDGKAGGVVHLVYLAAPVLPPGMSVTRSVPEQPEDAGEWVDLDLNAGTITMKPEAMKMMFYNDIEDDKVIDELVAGTQSMSLGALASELTRAAWEYTPSTMLMCEKDLGLPVERAEKQLKAARERVPGVFESVEKCRAAHVPFVSMPEYVADFLRRVAGEAL